jgi:hypothetical protein
MFRRLHNDLTKVSRPKFLEPVTMTLYEKRNNADVMELKTLRWEDDPKKTV